MIEWYKFALPWAVGNVMVDLVSLAKRKISLIKQGSSKKIGIIYSDKYDFHLPLIKCNPYIDDILEEREYVEKYGITNVLDPTEKMSWNYLVHNKEVARFNIPEYVVQKCRKKLEDNNIFPGKDKILSYHARQPGYKYYPEANRHQHRFVDIKTFEQLSKFYVEKGYKIIRIGDESFPELSYKNENIFDSAKTEDKTIMDDCGFIGLSDCFVGTDSGMWLISVSLGIPTLLSNHCHGRPGIGMKRWWFPWEDGHEVLHKRPFFDQTEIDASLMVKIFNGMGWLSTGQIELKDNTLEQLIECCERLLKGDKPQ